MRFAIAVLPGCLKLCEIVLFRGKTTGKFGFMLQSEISSNPSSPAGLAPLIVLFAEALNVDPASLSDASSPENVSQWDSLAAMHLVSAIEERFHVRLSTKEIMKMSSIGLARATLRGKGIDV